MKTIAIVGNPNSGKTTLFNSLTKLKAHTGNWAGVTVEKKEGIYHNKEIELKIIDLPGIYSFFSYSLEEKITKDFILNEKIDCIINIIDSSNLQRNLYLTTQLMELDIPIVGVINSFNKNKINIKQLEDNFQIPFINISAVKNEKIDLLMKKVFYMANTYRKGQTVLSNSKISLLIDEYKKNFKKNKLFSAIKYIEENNIKFNDDYFENDIEAYIANYRYKVIENILVKKEKDDLSYKIDRLLTNKWLGIPIFIVILFLIFHFTFSHNLFFLKFIFKNIEPSFKNTIFEGVIYDEEGLNSIGMILFNFFNTITNFLSKTINQYLISLNVKIWARDLLVNGVLSGAFNVINFIPQILTVFFFFSILEDTGYMARIAFILDKILQKFGLSGIALISMILGFGCSVPAIMNTRTIIDNEEKKKTIRVIPFFCCSAKMPLITSVAGCLVSSFGISNVDFIITGVYIFCILLTIISLLIMNKLKKEKNSPFIMELPNYHLPKLNNIIYNLQDKLKHFLTKTFTIILTSSIIIWFLLHFSWDFSYIDNQIDKSILSKIGQFMQIFFTPLGFGKQLSSYGWIFSLATLTGLIAKENIIGSFFTLSYCIFNSLAKNQIDSNLWNEINSMMNNNIIDNKLIITFIIELTDITWQGLFSFMIFNLITIPCLASVISAKQEMTKKEFIYTILFWLLTSYLVSSLLYLLLIYPIFMIFVIFSLLIMFFSFKKIWNF